MADIAELIVALKLQDGVSSGLGRLNGQLRGMQGGLSQVGRGIGQVGSGLDRIATRGAIAAAAGLTAVVTAAVSFEDAFAGVRKTVDASESEFGALEDRLREMARTIPVSFEELAGIAEAGGALGIAFEGLDEFTQVVADLAATTDLSADQAATSLGVLGNVLQLRAEDFDNFGSALVDLGNKGASTETQILDIAERIGATAGLVGLSADEVLGFSAAVANLGIEAEAGGSAIQRFLIDALTAVETGGEDLETFARVAGQSADVFQTAFREDAAEALEDFLTGLGQLPEAVQIETLQDLGFNDVRITRTLLGLAGDADNLTDSLNISATAFAENSALGVEAAKRYATAASQIKILKQNVTDAAVVIGEQLLPVVAELTGDLVEFINRPGTQAAIKEFGENLAGGIRDFVAEIRNADFGPLMDTLRGAAAIAKAGFDAFRALPPGVQSLALAAFGINKLTGGALGGIAGGLGNIIGGGIKLIFERGASPANPLWVQQVGLPGGGGGVGLGPGAGLLGLLGPLAAAAAALTAFTIAGEQVFKSLLPQVHEFNSLVAGTEGRPSSRIGLENELNALSQELGRPVDDLRAEMIPLLQAGNLTWNEILAEIRNPRPPLGPALSEFLKFTLRPNFSEARNRTDRATLPDTAMQPLTTAINGLRDVIASRDLTGASEARNVTDRTQRIFVESVKLDPSQVTDLREPTRIAAEQLRVLTLDARAADTANRTASNFLATEAIKNRMETSARLTTLASKYDSQVASLNGVNARLDSSNAKLAAIQAKNFSPTINVENRVSSTVITNNIAQQHMLSGTRPTPY